MIRLREFMVQRFPTHPVRVKTVTANQICWARVYSPFPWAERLPLDPDQSCDQRTFRNGPRAEDGFLGLPAVDVKMRTSFPRVVAGLVLIDPFVAGMDGKPVRGSLLSEDLAARNENYGEAELDESHDSSGSMLHYYLHRGMCNAH